MRGLFQSLGLVPYAITVDMDCSTQAQTLLALVNAGAFDQASEFMADIHEEDQQNFYWCWGMCPDAIVAAERWCAHAADSEDALLLLAFAYLGEGWRLRGEDYYDAIPEERRQLLPRAFNRAHQLFSGIEARPNSDPLVYLGLIHCDLVCGIEAERRDERFDQAMARVPFHTPTISIIAKGSMEKWGGSDAQMWRHLKWISDGAPRGHGAHAVIASHFVEWTYPMVDQCDSTLDLVARIRGHDLSGLMRKALLDWLDAEPEQLKERLAMRTSDRSRKNASWFALALYLSGAWEEARVVLASLGGKIPAEPWYGLSYRGSGLIDRILGADGRHAGVAHDRICRDLGLSPRKISRQHG